MKKILCITLALTFALFASGASAYTVYARSDDGSRGYVYGRERCDILPSHQSGPDEALGVFPAGATAEYLGVNRTDDDSDYRPWYKIRYDGVVGWVSGRYTELHESDDDEAYCEYSY